MIARTDVGAIGHWWSMIAVVVNILTILMLVHVARRKGQTFLQLINYQKGQTGWTAILLVTLLVLVVGHAFIDLATAVQIVATSMVPGLYESMCGL